MSLLPKRATGAHPAVSVVVGVKNGAASLQRCLDSIAEQDWLSRETIVIDGASTDGTRELLQENLRTGKVSEFVSEPDRGLYDAWNKALRRCRGDWVCFLGCDDRFHDARALRHLIEAQVPGVRVFYGRVRVITSKGVVGAVHGRPWAEARAAFLAGTMIPHPGTLHHRSLFEEHGLFDESYRIAGDYEMLLRELPGRDAVFVDRVVVDMSFGGISGRPATIYAGLRELQRARAAHGLRHASMRLRIRLAAGWIGAWIQRFFGERAYCWCADLYRLARGKRRIWTV